MGAFKKLKRGRCGEWSMRSLWKLDISTAMPNNLQAEFGMAPAAEGDKGKMQHSCLVRCLCFESSDCRFLPFLRTTMSCPALGTAAPPPSFAAVYNKLVGGGWGCCVSILVPSPSGPSFFECPAHLVLGFLYVCLLFFLHLLLSPVRFLGWAHADCESHQCLAFKIFQNQKSNYV
jgi:hypothetical protein